MNCHDVIILSCHAHLSVLLVFCEFDLLWYGTLISMQLTSLEAGKDFAQQPSRHDRLAENVVGADTLTFVL